MVDFKIFKKINIRNFIIIFVKRVLNIVDDYKNKGGKMILKSNC